MASKLEPISGQLEVESNAAYIVTYANDDRPQANEIFYASEWETMAWLERTAETLDAKQAKLRLKRMRKAVSIQDSSPGWAGHPHPAQ